MVEALEEKLKLKIPRNFDSDETCKFLEKLAEENKVVCPPPKTAARLLDKLVGISLR